MTFEPVPVMFFNKEIKNHRINSLEQKIAQLKKFKLDFLILIKFNKNFHHNLQKSLSKNNFEKTKCKYLFVSKNFKFGFKRQGNINTLKNLKKNINLSILSLILAKK